MLPLAYTSFLRQTVDMELSLEKRKPKGSPLDYGEDYDYNQLWSEKYEPKLSKDLVLHHSKIKATRDCLLRFCSQKSGHLSHHQYHYTNRNKPTEYSYPLWMLWLWEKYIDQNSL